MEVSAGSESTVIYILELKRDPLTPAGIGSSWGDPYLERMPGLEILPKLTEQGP